MTALLLAFAVALPVSPGPTPVSLRATPVSSRFTPAGTPVGVGLREWRIGVYRTSVRPGRVRLNMTNFGEDAHNLQVSGRNGYRSAVSADVAPFGGRLTLTVNLRRPGTYRLLCVKPGHPQLGMRATLRVTRARRR